MMGVLDALKVDYYAMRNMIYGEIPDFEVILNYLSILQEEEHELNRKRMEKTSVKLTGY